MLLFQDLVEEWQTPQLMIDGMTRDDIKQGILGDCWFLSSCAAVSQREKYMKKVTLIRIFFKEPLRDQILDFKHLLKIASGYFSHLLKMLINLLFH